MRTSVVILAAGCLLVGLSVRPILAAETTTNQIVADLSQVASVDDVRVVGDKVTGRITNRTGDELRDVRLLIEEPFRWNDEFHPGEDNPGRATAAVLPKAIPPRGSVQFELDLPPRPPRQDGTFDTAVTVVSLTRVEAMPQRDSLR